MRGRPNPQRSMLAIVDLEKRVPQDHPLRRIKEVADAALARLSPTFDHMYARGGRASVPPERLLKASLRIALYSVRSERAFCEELEYNLLYRWFLDMDLMERSFDATVFTKNRQRLLAHDAGRALFDEVVWAADGEGLLSDEHFSVDGTLIEAAASLKSFRSKEGPPPPTDDDPGNPSVDFRGERRCNETHASTTDPEARLLRKGPGQEARLAFLGHALMENRHGLVMDFTVSPATGTAERDAVPELLDGLRERGYRPRTLGADRGYDTKDCVRDIRARRVTPHVAQKKKHSAIDGRTTRHAGYAVSLRIRKRAEEIFGWMKTVGGLRRTCTVLDGPGLGEWAADPEAWPDLRSLVRVQAERTGPRGRRQRSVRYYISSRPVDAEALLDRVRGHWGVENGLHRTLDLQFREDDCRIRTGHAPAVMGILRRAALP